MKKSPYYEAISFVIVSSFLLVFIHPFESKRTSFNTKDYKFFRVEVTKSPFIGRQKSHPLMLETNILDDLSKYRERFFLQERFYDTESYVAKTIQKNIQEGDTLILGILLSDFLEVQGYGSNFIKGDFANRELKLFWVKKKNQVLLDPKFLSDEKSDQTQKFVYLFFLLAIWIWGIGKIAYLITQKVKFFT